MHAYAADTPYRFPLYSPETVAALSRDDVVAFHDTHYRPGLAHLVIAGSFDEDGRDVGRAAPGAGRAQVRGNAPSPRTPAARDGS